VEFLTKGADPNRRKVWLNSSTFWNRGKKDICDRALNGEKTNTSRLPFSGCRLLAQRLLFRHLPQVGLLIVVGDQAHHHCCIVPKPDNGVGAGPGHTCHVCNKEISRRLRAATPGEML